MAFTSCARSCVPLSFFLYMASMRWVTRKPPKMLTDARASATEPKHLGDQHVPVRPPELDAATASRAPTMITEEMALVTAISGVCRAGVTLQTT